MLYSWIMGSIAKGPYLRGPAVILVFPPQHWHSTGKMIYNECTIFVSPFVSLDFFFLFVFSNFSLSSVWVAIFTLFASLDVVCRWKQYFSGVFTPTPNQCKIEANLFCRINHSLTAKSNICRSVFLFFFFRSKRHHAYFSVYCRWLDWLIHNIHIHSWDRKIVVDLLSGEYSRTYGIHPCCTNFPVISVSLALHAHTVDLTPRFSTFEDSFCLVRAVWVMVGSGRVRTTFTILKTKQVVWMVCMV